MRVLRTQARCSWKILGTRSASCGTEHRENTIGVGEGKKADVKDIKTADERHLGLCGEMQRRLRTGPWARAGGEQPHEGHNAI